MIKVLVICPLDLSGYSQAGINYSLSLDSVGVDVVIRSIGEESNDLPERIKELLAKPSTDCDAVIQLSLPTYWEYNEGVGVNIGLFCTEFDQFNYSGWADYVNLMDEAWVFNFQSQQASWDSGVEIPIAVVPPPCDVDKYFRSYKPYLPESPNFRFYTIGEHTKRKNFAALVKAFHLEFSIDEPVELVIKTNPGARDQLLYEIEAIKAGLGIYPSPNLYKRELVITDHLSEEEICGLHLSCDNYVGPTFGDAWNLGAFDSLGFGNTPILSDYAGHKEFCNDSVGWMVSGRMEPVFALTGSSPPGYGTSYENWYSVDIRNLQDCMREAYEDPFGRERKRELGLQSLDRFSYKKIGRLMKSLLEAAIQRKQGDDYDV